MHVEEYKSLIKRITGSGMESAQNIQDIHDLLVGMQNDGLLEDADTRKFAMKYSKYAHEMCQ